MVESTQYGATGHLSIRRWPVSQHRLTWYPLLNSLVGPGSVEVLEVLLCHTIWVSLAEDQEALANGVGLDGRAFSASTALSSV
jgi:hypothetical protein